MLCIAILGVLLSTWMLIYVNLKLCDKTLSGNDLKYLSFSLNFKGTVSQAFYLGNQTMGVLLLLGTMLLFAASVPWLLPPSNAICAVRSVVFAFFHKKSSFLVNIVVCTRIRNR